MVIPSLLRRPREGLPRGGSSTLQDPLMSTSTSSSSSSSRPTASDTSASSSSHHDSIMRRQEQRAAQSERLQAVMDSSDSDPDEGDDVHSDPSMWIDIVPNEQQAPEQLEDSSRRTRPYGSDCLPSTPTIRIPIPSLLVDCVTFCFDWTYAAVEIWAEVLSAPPFPLSTLHKVSIVLLGVERIRDNLDHSALVVLLMNHHPSSSSVETWSSSIPQYIVWGIPGIVALLSVSFVLTLQLSWGHQEEAVIATALILLIFLEALLPLFILGCTSMFLFQQVSWETGLVLLVMVWLGSTFCAHCIRRMLYQSLGHG
ncbi:expressed unknown protein [Seminavis robusta]|uniref:Transmembrane protein n=1 Tax=Seminavis robusta TaxID=568900 RepID=A0A9N8EGW9_9STRA|nr:expressed unknown protein [Seminavis robusta]|eukprot:Sro1078_g238760.1 n/a (312) ;mRNA; f:17520-18455